MKLIDRLNSVSEANKGKKNSDMDKEGIIILNKKMKFRLFVCLSVRLHFCARGLTRHTYLVLARSLKSWEGFRPGFVAFGCFWPELLAIIGTKVEKWPKNG